MPRADALEARDPVLAAAPGAAEPSAPSIFEARAEASEKVIPVGLEGTLNDVTEPLTLGQPPPRSYPRTRCEDIYVYIVTVAEGVPLQSAASLGIGKTGPARLRHPGERLGDWRVLAITDDWSGLKPDVWLDRSGVVCQAKFAGNRNRPEASGPSAPAKPRPPATPRGRPAKR